MLAFSYCMLLLVILHHGKLSANEEANEDNCCPTIVKQLSETMDLVCETNSRVNNTEVMLDQLMNDLTKTRIYMNASQERLARHIDTDLQIKDALSKIHERLANAENRTKQDTTCVVLGPRDCSDIRAMGFTTSGVYRIYAGGDNKRVQGDVYCDFDIFGESWLVFQRRMDGSENFKRNYTHYARGFGNFSGEFWGGNELVHLLTTNRKYKLHIDLEDFEGERRYAEYTTFVVNSISDYYRLTIAGYSGDAGDSMRTHNNMRFSAQNVDADSFPNDSCARRYQGAWWYNNCHHANLNGLYLGGPHKSFADGINWYAWHGMFYSLKKTEMKLMLLVNN